MKIKQLSIFLQNKIGSLSNPLNILSEENINIRAMSMADTSEFCILRLVVDNPDKGKEILEKNNFLVKVTEIIGVEMDDSPGGLTSVLKILKDNNIDLEYLYAFTHDKVGKAILLIHTSNPDKTAKILMENEVILVSSDDVYNM